MEIAHGPLGGKRDARDERDFPFQTGLTTLPPTASLRPHCPAVYDQLPLRSCSANAIASALRMLASATSRVLPEPSRLFLYYNARLREGPVENDDGATLRNAIKAAAKPGACAESTWPYDASKVNVEPRRDAYEQIVVRATAYFRIPQDLAALRACIAEGFPFVFGLNAYTQPVLRAQTTGHLDLPQPSDTFMCGHAMLAVAYDDAVECFTVLNSLGTSWGAQGYVTMPYGYFTNPDLTHDFWMIRSIA